MCSVNYNIIKNCLKLYEDKSLSNNYSNISNQYNKLYIENKNKKCLLDNNDKLKDDVKKWLFSQPLEARIKICTVENEIFGKFLYQMIQYYKLDKTMEFQPKPSFYYEEDNNQFIKNISSIDNFNKTNDSILYPQNNTNIKVTKTNKSGKKTEIPKLGYSQSSLKDFKDEEILSNHFGNYFTFQSSRKMKLTDYNSESKDIIDPKIKENIIEELLNNIIYFSVHHKNFPDCFTLSPEFLLEKEKFENCFQNISNKQYFFSLIETKSIEQNTSSNKSQKLYNYNFPSWFENEFHSVSTYAIAFFEQVIMIKYFINKYDKKLKIYSLLNEQALKRFFDDRKLAINYIKKNYNAENRINLLKELDIINQYNNLVNNYEKMKFVNYFKQNHKQINNDKFKNNPHTIQIINNNHFADKNEEKFFNMKKISKSKSRSNDDEPTIDQIIEKLTGLLNSNDEINGSVFFIDYLLFRNYNNLWKIEYFLQLELFEKLSNLIMEQNCNELISDSKQTKSNKSKHRKKNKKNNNNNIQASNEEQKNNNNNKINEYEGILKDDKEELYAPYYLKVNTGQNKLFKLKVNNININNINNTNDNIKEKEEEAQEIKQFISKEIILKIVIDNVFLTPLNSFINYDGKFKINDNNIEKNEDKINTNIINEKSEDKEIKNIIYEEDQEKQDKKDLINNIYINNIKKEEKANNVPRETDIENNDSLSLKSDAISSEIDKTTTTTINNNDINENNNPININNIEDNNNNKYDNKNNNSNNSKNKSQKKKKEKEQTFFLFDTVKKKKKKTTQTAKNNNTLVSNEFNIITIKDTNNRLSFYDKLHNDIIKYETKVITLLNHGMKFKDYCITEIKRLIQETFNNSEDYNIDVYGSYATGLMIEASDIDIKIKLNSDNRTDLNNFFETLYKKLEKEKKFDKINPIGTASVPVIKLLLNSEKFIKGKEDLENSFKQYKESSLFKHYLFDINELTKIKIDVTFILSNNSSKNNNNIIDIKEKNSENNMTDNNINNNNNENFDKKNNTEKIHDHDKSIGGELSSVAYVKEQILKYPEIKFILRVLKRYFYYKKMNSSFLGGLSSYNLFLLLLSYSKYIRISPNPQNEIIESETNKNKINLGYFLFNFLYFFNCIDFKQYIIDINSPNIYDIIIPEKAKEFNFGKSIVIIDPLTGVNASKSSYKIDEIQSTFTEAFDFFQEEERNYDKEGKTKVYKNNNKNNDNILMGLPTNYKNENNHGGNNNIIEKFLGK